MKKLVTWFKGLSVQAKIGVIGGAAMGLFLIHEIARAL